MVGWVKMLWTHLCILIIKRNILILGKVQTHRLDNTTLTAETEYSINFTESGKIFMKSTI